MEQEKKQNNQKFFHKPWVQSVAGIVFILLVAGSVLFYKLLSSRVSIDNSIVSAPVISIGPENEGILQGVYVHPGDKVTAGTVVARVGAEVLSAKVSGIVIDVSNTPGQVFVPSQAVVKMIDPNELRIVGTVKENEGLADIHTGEPVSFTVDAFPGKTWSGVVDSISPTSKESGVTFNISDQREVKEFEVKVLYDVVAHPEFRNGMSAKIKVFKK